MKLLTQRSTSAIVLAVGAALATTAPAATAAETSARVSGGSTTLTLDKATAKVLSTNGVAVSVVGPAKVRKSGGVVFPVAPTGSTLDPASYAGTLNHTGGLRFRAGGKTLRLTNFRVSVGSASTLNARINSGGRATIISLDISKVKATRNSINTSVRGIVASLNKTGAAALNKYFGVKLFQGGLRLGTVTSEAKFGEIVFAGGTTELALDSGLLTALTGLGIAPGVVAPTTLAGATASFPITGGKVDAAKLTGSITHSGGLSLTKGTTKVELTEFDIQVPQMLAKVNGAAPAAIIDLDASKVTVNGGDRNITVGNVVVKLSAAGAQGLNTALGTTALTAGLVLGVATVKGQAR